MVTPFEKNCNVPELRHFFCSSPLLLHLQDINSWRNACSCWKATAAVKGIEKNFNENVEEHSNTIRSGRVSCWSENKYHERLHWADGWSTQVCKDMRGNQQLKTHSYCLQRLYTWKCVRVDVFRNVGKRDVVKNIIVFWLILPVVTCLSQRLSHACLSTHCGTVKPRMAH